MSKIIRGPGPLAIHQPHIPREKKKNNPSPPLNLRYRARGQRCIQAFNCGTAWYFFATCSTPFFLPQCNNRCSFYQNPNLLFCISSVTSFCKKKKWKTPLGSTSWGLLKPMTRGTHTHTSREQNKKIFLSWFKHKKYTEMIWFFPCPLLNIRGSQRQTTWQPWIRLIYSAGLHCSTAQTRSHSKVCQWSTLTKPKKKKKKLHS